MALPPAPAVRGVTLVELMVAVCIVAILASLAYPSYTRYLHRSRRADALVALIQIQMAQERWRASHPAYTATLSDLNLGTLAAEASGHYRLTLALNGDGGYDAKATAVGSQTSDKACASLSLSVRAGQVHQSATGTAQADECWGMS
ncbi:MAG: type IV pilin protein [Hydrogenophaga sp.]|nr:type IV pilin protein [Hydrogenophaga sp.]